MTDIARIETDELRNDLLMSLADVLLCDQAMKDGHVSYSGGNIQERRDNSFDIVGKIYVEMAAREVAEAHEAVAGIGFEPG